MGNRDDFREPIKRLLRDRVTSHCSNPLCNVHTIGPQKQGQSTINIGVAAHITAAAQNGFRFDETLTPNQRKHYDNGIWLCASCARLIDSDVATYTTGVLQNWKKQAVEKAYKDIGQQNIADRNFGAKHDARSILLLVIGLLLFLMPTGSWWLKRHQKAPPQRAIRPATSKLFTVLITDLNGLNGRAQSDNMFQILGQAQGITAFRVPKALVLEQSGEFTQSLAAIEAEGQRLMAESNADVLIWGDATATKLRLRFLPRSGTGTTLGYFQNLDESPELSVDFRKQLGDQLVATTLSSLGELNSRTVQVAGLLIGLIGKLRAILTSPQLLTAEQRASMHVALARAANIIGDVNGDTIMLNSATTSLQEALNFYQSKGRVDDVSFISYLLAQNLSLVGQRNRSKTSLMKAKEKYEASIRTSSFDRNSSLWFRSYHGLGITLVVLGELENTPENLVHAVALFADTLSSAARYRDLESWFAIQVNLCIAQLDLGMMNQDTLAIERAIGICSRSTNSVNLSVRRAAHISLGSGLASHARLTFNSQELKDAVQAYTTALTFVDPTRSPTFAAEIQLRLSQVNSDLGLATRETSPFVAAQHAAQIAITLLGNRPPSKSLVDAQNALGMALFELGRSDTKNSSELFQARTVLEDALKSRVNERRSSEWAKTKGMLAGVIAEIAIRRNDKALLREALVQGDSALTATLVDGEPYDWALLQQTRAYFLISLATRTRNPNEAIAAIHSLEAALNLQKPQWSPIFLATMHNSIGVALMLTDELSQTHSHYIAAGTSFERALSLIQSQPNTQTILEYQQNLALSLLTQSGFDPTPERLLRAIDILEGSIPLAKKSGDAFRLRALESDLRVAKATLQNRK